MSATRRTALRWMAAAPGALLLGCGDDRRPMAPGPDAGLGDAATGTDAATAIDAGGGNDADVRVDASEPLTCDPTTEDALGPFYENGAPLRSQIASTEEPGERLRVDGKLLDVRDCRTALAGYRIDLWQADANGDYVDPGPEFRLRGRITTGSDGSFSFESIIPGHYRIAAGDRPAHIHFRVFTPEGSSLLVSQMYFEGDPFVGAADACQPPTCWSNDAARILRLTPAMIDGRAGKMAMLPLFV